MGLSNFMCVSYMICRGFCGPVCCLSLLSSLPPPPPYTLLIHNENANETRYTQKTKLYNTCTYICQLQHDFWQICLSFRWHISERVREIFGSTAMPMPIYIVGDNKFLSLFEAPLSKRNAWFVFYNEAEWSDVLMMMKTWWWQRQGKYARWI